MDSLFSLHFIWYILSFLIYINMVRACPFEWAIQGQISQEQE
jgi:hypothetical protein